MEGQSPLLLVLLLSGCGMFGGDGKTKSDAPLVTGTVISTETVSLGNGYGLNLPKILDGFVRTDTSDPPAGSDVVAGYARTEPPAPIIATVRVHKVGGKGTLDLLAETPPAATLDQSASALKASIAQVRHFYPDATTVATGPAFIVRFGAMQNGRAATLSYVDTMDGVRQPILLRIETFCCLDQTWDYEFRFRYPASLAGTGTPIDYFLRDVAWSPEPSGSIDKPE